MNLQFGVNVGGGTAEDPGAMLLADGRQYPVKLGGGG
jgi:hypothetical protein